MDPGFYDKWYANEIEKKIKMNDDFQGKYLFNKLTNNKGDAVNRLKEKNKDLYELFMEYPNNLDFYWSEERPRYQFSVFDNKDVLLEEKDHNPFGSKDVFISKNNKVLAKEYGNEHFERIINNKRVHKIM